MKHKKDIQIVEHIVRYCDEVSMALEDYDFSRERFEKSPVFRNACSMPLCQIGELAKHLSNDALTKMRGIPWKNVKGMRDFFVHEYHHMNIQTIWEAALEDVPALRKVCSEYLKAAAKEAAERV